MGLDTIGVVHPGEMGSAVAALAAGEGRTLLWASTGRREASRKRAAAAGLVDVMELGALTERCDLVISLCPPDAALEVARQLSGFAGLYLDANAVAPATAREVARIVEGSGGRFVDGAVIGPPPAPGRRSDLCLSGPYAEEVAALFAGTCLRTRLVPGGPGAASAVKMCFAAWTKASTALLLSVRALAIAEGVEGPLLEEWDDFLPDLAGRSLQGAHQAATKAWRWVGEMEEVAATYRSAQLPSGFQEAAAALYARVKRDERAEVTTQTLRAVLHDIGTASGQPPDPSETGEGSGEQPSGRRR